MYRRDDEKLHCRDGEKAEHFSASQGAEQAGFSAQGGSEDVEDSCRRAGDAPGFWKSSGISGAEPRLRVALAALEEMKVLMARVTATLHALQFPVQPPRCPLQPSMDPVLADLIANLARESSSAHPWSEDEEHNDVDLAR